MLGWLAGTRAAALAFHRKGRKSGHGKSALQADMNQTALLRFSFASFVAKYFAY
jgi:hypothetical protein